MFIAITVIVVLAKREANVHVMISKRKFNREVKGLETPFLNSLLVTIGLIILLSDMCWWVYPPKFAALFFFPHIDYYFIRALL